MCIIKSKLNFIIFIHIILLHIILMHIIFLQKNDNPSLLDYITIWHCLVTFQLSNRIDQTKKVKKAHYDRIDWYDI